MALYRVKDNVDDASVANIAQFHGVKSPFNLPNFLEKKNPYSYSENKILVKKGTVLTLFNGTIWKIFVVKDADIELSETDLDTGSFAVGNDYYVYLVDSGDNGGFKISLNSTAPAGYNSDTSRKIGGFHYGHIRKVSSDGLWVPIDGAGTKFGNGTPNWKDNVTIGIVPNSVWDLKNRPLCSPDGMVKVGRIWVDIYLSSVAETIAFESNTAGLHIASGRLQSKYGQIPVSGSEGLNWYSFNELAARSNKRLLSYGEWVKAAYGNPQGLDAADTYGWTKTTNSGRTRTGCQVNTSTGAYDPSGGVKPAAISAYNCVDCIGNLWEWLDELSNRHDSTTWTWYDVMSGWGKGQAYLPNSTGVTAYLAGAGWDDGVHGGARTVSVGGYPWYVNTGVGARLACDSL